jgi:hypothetical protein
MSLQSQLESSVHAERHYAVTGIAEMRNLSADEVRELFEEEPGVSAGNQHPRDKRWYVTHLYRFCEMFGVESVLAGVPPGRVQTVQSLRMNSKNRLWSGRSYA